MGRPAAARSTRTTMSLAATIVLASLAITGCGGAAASPAASAAPSTRVAAPSVTPITTASATPAVSSSPSAASSPAPLAEVTMTSKLYPYRLKLPGSAVPLAPTLASDAWDGTTRIDSGDAHTDWLGLDGGRTFFIYGAPTRASLADLAASSQAQVAEWHGCATGPESTTDTTVGGAPARLHVFHCQGLLVMKLMTLADGFGLVINQIGPDGDAAAEQALFLDRLAGFAWTA